MAIFHRFIFKKCEISRKVAFGQRRIGGGGLDSIMKILQKIENEI